MIQYFVYNIICLQADGQVFCCRRSAYLLNPRFLPLVLLNLLILHRRIAIYPTEYKCVIHRKNFVPKNLICIVFRGGMQHFLLLLELMSFEVLFLRGKNLLVYISSKNETPCTVLTSFNTLKRERPCESPSICQQLTLLKVNIPRALRKFQEKLPKIISVEIQLHVHVFDVLLNV